MKKKLLLLPVVILLTAVSVWGIHSCITPEIPKDEEPILKMLYQESKIDSSYYIRLFENGVYEVYRGAFFLYPDQPFDLSLWFYDVKARRLGQGDMEHVIDVMNDIKDNYEPDPNLPVSYSMYAVADIYGIRYASAFSDEEDKEFKESLYELYTIISDSAPKIWFYNGPLREYDEDGDIGPIRDSIPTDSPSEM